MSLDVSARPWATEAVAAGVPPEWWQRLVRARVTWLVGHPRAAQWLARVVAVRAWGAVGVLVVAVVVVPEVRGSVRAWAGAVVILIVWFLAVRTKTVTWRATVGMFVVCAGWAGVVGVATVTLAQALGLTVDADGSHAALAGFVEEPTKLVPLLVLAVAAPGRVRRFAAGDWAVLGFASGLGFTVTEEVTRVVVTFGERDTFTRDWTLNPWTTATFTSGDLTAHAAGHHIWTVTIAMTIGLSVVLWRTRHWWARAVAPVLPVVVLWWCAAEHNGFNGRNGDPRWPGQGLAGYPEALTWVWSATGHGRGTTLISVVLLVGCWVVDTHRRNLAGPPGQVVDGFGSGDRAAAWWAARLEDVDPPALGRGLVRLGQMMARGFAQGLSDLLVVVAAYGRPRGPAESRLAVARGARDAVVHTRVARELAMAVTTPGREPATRRIFAAAAAVGGTAVLAAMVWAGARIAAAVGPWWRDPDDGVFLAGLLDGAGTWWDGLGLGGQILVGAAVAALVVLSGGTMMLGMGVAGAATWGLTKAHGAATFSRDPAAATRSYLATTTPQAALIDVGEFVLTFAPGNFAGAAAGRAVRGELAHYAADPATYWSSKQARMTGDAGALYPAEFLARKPVDLVDGTTLAARSDAEQAAFTARYEELPSSRLTAKDAEGAYQVRVYGNSERSIPLPNELPATPDGISAQYGAIGDAKFVSAKKSFYVPETLHPDFAPIAVDKVDTALGKLARGADAFAGKDGVVEIATNDLRAARFFEGRLSTLGIRGYVRIVEGEVP